MALTETTKVDQIEVVGDHTIQVRTATISGTSLTVVFKPGTIDSLS